MEYDVLCACKKWMKEGEGDQGWTYDCLTENGRCGWRPKCRNASSSGPFQLFNTYDLEL